MKRTAISGWLLAVSISMAVVGCGSQPTDPTTGDPTSGDPALADPAASDPTPADPASGNPTPSNPMGVSPSANPQAKLDTAIADMIALLEAEDYGDFLNKYLLPEELATFRAKGQFDEIVEGMGPRAPAIVAGLKSVQGKTPTLTATHRIQGVFNGPPEMPFALVEGGEWRLYEGSQKQAPKNQGDVEDPQAALANLDATIAKMIQHLEAGDHAALFNLCMPKEMLEQAKREGKFDAMIADFGEKRADEMVAALKSFQGQTPKVTAVFDDVPSDQGPRDLKFGQIKGLWYMMN